MTLENDVKFQPLFRVLRDHRGWHRCRNAYTKRARVSFVFYFPHFFCTYIRYMFIYIHICSICSYRTRKKLWEVVRGKNVVVNVDGGFQYSGNYVVTAGVFLGYLPNEDFSVESKKNYLIQGMVIMLRAVDSSNQFFSILLFFWLFKCDAFCQNAF